MSRVMLAAALAGLTSAAAACGDDTTDYSISQSKGERAARTALETRDIVGRQLAMAMEHADPSAPAFMLTAAKPTIKGPRRVRTEKLPADESATGFYGPVAGPDGLSTWYVQDVSVTMQRQTAAGQQTVVSGFRFYLRATPGVDLRSGWPEKLLSMELAVDGMGGLYDGFRFLQTLNIKGSDLYEGTWEQSVTDSTDPLSLAKFYAGSRFAGSYRLQSDSGVDTDIEGYSSFSASLAKTKETVFSQSINLVDRWPGEGTLIDDLPNADATRNAWYLRWQRTDDLNQTASYKKGVYTLKGPATYRILGYWGRGAEDPKALREPAYDNGAEPRGSGFATPGSAATEGLFGWFEIAFNAQNDFVYVEKDGKGEVSGTCAVRASLLRHNGKRCSLKIDACTMWTKKIFWKAPTAECPL